MQKLPRQWLHILATVGWLTSVGVTIVDATEPSQAVLPVVISVAADGVQRATVTLDSYSYSPNHLIVETGKPVELTLISVTTIIPHNFIIKDPAGSLSVEQDVSAGKTVTLKFTPTQAGTFPIYCDNNLCLQYFFRFYPLPQFQFLCEVQRGLY